MSYERDIVSAVFDLPVPIWVVGAILGTRTPTGLGQLTFEVHTPKRFGTGEIGPPETAGLPLDHEELTDEAWATRFAAWTDDDAIALCRVAITARLSANSALRESGRTEEPNSQLRHALGSCVDPWFDCLRSWVEVVTGQDLDPAHTVYDAESPGHALRFWTGDTFEPPGLLSLTTPRVVPLHESWWTPILRYIHKGVDPPLEELLSRDARAAHRRGHYRRAIIDAATAADIVLNRLLETSVDLLVPKVRQAVEGKELRTFGQNISLAERAALPIRVPIHQLRELNQARNDAAHRGLAPSGWDTANVVQISIDLLAAHGRYQRSEQNPVPGPGDWIPIDEPQQPTSDNRHPK